MQQDENQTTITPAVVTAFHSVLIKDARKLFLDSPPRISFPPFFADNDPHAIWKVGIDGTNKGANGLSIFITIEIAIKESRKIHLNGVEVTWKDSNGSALDSIEVAKDVVLSNGNNVMRAFSVKLKSEKLLALDVKIEYIKDHTVHTTRKVRTIDTDWDLKYDLLKYLESQDDADVKFDVDGQILYAHRQILSSRSWYFRSMFQSGMAESGGAPIIIPDATASSIKHVLNFIYGGVLPDKSTPDVDALIVVADKYGLDGLKLHCGNVLIKRLDPSNVCDRLLLADTHGCPALKERCIDIIKQNRKDVIKPRSRVWKEISKRGELVAAIMEAVAS